MRISDWSSDVCSSDLEGTDPHTVLLVLDGCDRWLQFKHADLFIDLVRKLHQRLAKLYVILTHDEIDERLPAPHVVEIGPLQDRKSVVSGKSVSVRVDLGGRRIIKKKQT